jgi:hypothetical protein
MSFSDDLVYVNIFDNPTAIRQKKLSQFTSLAHHKRCLPFSSHWRQRQKDTKINHNLSISTPNITHVFAQFETQDGRADNSTPQVQIFQ